MYFCLFYSQNISVPLTKKMVQTFAEAVEFRGHRLLVMMPGQSFFNEDASGVEWQTAQSSFTLNVS